MLISQPEPKIYFYPTSEEAWTMMMGGILIEKKIEPLETIVADIYHITDEILESIKKAYEFKSEITLIKHRNVSSLLFKLFPLNSTLQDRCAEQSLRTEKSQYADAMWHLFLMLRQSHREKNSGNVIIGDAKASQVYYAHLLQNAPNDVYIKSFLNTLKKGLILNSGCNTSIEITTLDNVISGRTDIWQKRDADDFLFY